MPRFLALDGDQQMHLLSATVKNRAVKLEKALAWAEGVGLSAVNAAELGRRLRERLKEAGIAPAPVLVCLGRDRVILKELKYPPVPESEEAAVVRFQASKELTDSPEDVLIDYCPLGEVGGEKRALAVVVRKDLLRAYRTFCEAAGLKMLGVVPRPFAAVAALQRAIVSGAVNPPEPAEGVIAVLARGERWGELTITRNGGGQVLFSRTLSGPALNSETALLGEVRRNLSVFAGQSASSAVQALYVVEADQPGGWSGRLRAGLSIPVHAFDPLAGLDADVPPESRGNFAGLVGVLALQARGAALPINFVAPREPKPPRDPNKRLVAAVSSVLLLLMVGGLSWGFSARAAKDRRIAQLLQEKNLLDGDLARFEEDAKRIKAVDDWSATEVVWLDELYDLTDRFPDPATTRLLHFVGEPLQQEKNAKSKYVARMQLKIITEDGKSVDRLMAAMVQDGHYRVDPKEPRGSTGIGGMRFNQQFGLRADIDHRLPGRYTRHLNASPPPRRSRAKEEDPFGGFGDFGDGGFGGMDFGGMDLGGAPGRRGGR